MHDLIYVYEVPNANFNQNVTKVCVPSQVSFVDASVTNSNIVNWMWDFGDGGSSNDQYPDYEYFYSGIYSVTLVVEDLNGCQNMIVYND